MLISHGIPYQSDTPVALTIGNFDGVHLGHQAMLAALKETARQLDVPSCVLTFEPHPREFFAPDNAPARLTSLREKIALFEAHGIDHVHVCPFNQLLSQMPAERFVREIIHEGFQAKALIIGDDFHFGARRQGNYAMLAAVADSFGFSVTAMPSFVYQGRRVSSTAVRDALAAGDMTLAAQLLGRPYAISGRVVQGDQLGRKLGYPTANIQMQHNQPPLSGIFAVQVHGLGPAPLPGVASLGVRPTVKAAGVPTLEVHLFDFDRDIYGAHVQVDFLHKLRDELKFDSLEALVAQIHKDAEDARRYLAAR